MEWNLFVNAAKGSNKLILEYSNGQLGGVVAVGLS
jgi:hypothetical protein